MDSKLERSVLNVWGPQVLRGQEYIPGNGPTKLCDAEQHSGRMHLSIVLKKVPYFIFLILFASCFLEAG